MIKLIINGSKGRMGRELAALLSRGGTDTVAVASVDRNAVGTTDETLRCPLYADINSFTGEADCIIDFSHHSVVKNLLSYATARGIPAVIATTGFDEDELVVIENAAHRIPVFRSANMSVGIALLASLVTSAAAAFPDAEIEIIEKHHSGKLDVPSGTAKMLAQAVGEARGENNTNFVVGRHENGLRGKNDVGIHSIRAGNIVGEHEVIIAAGSQIITLKHEAQSRALFAEGAVDAAKFLASRRGQSGLYNMNDLIEATVKSTDKEKAYT